MDDTFLSLRDVTVRHPGSTIDALDAITFDLSRGEVLAVLGSSGSGKTTLLRLIAGLVPVVSGSVELDGVDITATPTHTRGVGLMFQDHALFPHLDVGENVAFGLKMAGFARSIRSERVGEMLELVGLGGFERRAISTLSGGERQRVALARTVAPSPRVLLLDEPMGSLDRVLRDRLVPELGELIAAMGLTAIHVTHDRSEALALGDRIAVMDEGRIVQIDSPEQIQRTPVSAHVAALLGHE